MNGVAMIRTRIAVSLLALAVAPAFGQSWKKQNSATLPVVSEGSACNGDSNIALGVDRKSLLVCQSGAWVKPSVAPEKSKLISLYVSSDMQAVFRNYLICKMWNIHPTKFTLVQVAGSTISYTNAYGGYTFNKNDGSPLVAQASSTASFDCDGKSMQQIVAAAQAFD